MIKHRSLRIAGLVLLFVAVLALIFGACSKKKSEESNVQGVAEDLAGKKIVLAQYLVSKPGAVISSQSPIELEFSRAMVPEHMVNGLLSTKAFSMSPMVEGEARWLTQSLIRFVPKVPLTSGATYQVDVVGKEVFGKSVDVDNLSFAFRIIPQELLGVEGDFSPAPNEVNHARLELTLQFAQPVDLAKLKDDLKIKNGFFRLDYTLSAIGNGRQVKLVSQSLERTDEAKSLRLALASDWSASKQEYEQEFILAAKGNFVVVSHGEAPDARSEFRTWAVRFSDPLPSDQDWSGFVSIEPMIGFKVQVQGRNLRIRADFQPGTEYRLTLRAGLPSAYGIKLAQDWSGLMRFQNEKPKLQWTTPGVFLPLENKMRLQLKSMNVAKAIVKVFEVPSQNLVFFLQRNPLKTPGQDEDESYEDEYYDGDYCSGICDQERVSSPVLVDTLQFVASRNKWFQSDLDLSKLTEGKPGSVFLVELSFGENDLLGKCVDNPENLGSGDLLYQDDSWQGNPCESGYYYRNGTLRRILVLSSLGLTVKKLPSGFEVWASDVAEPEPVRGLELKLISFSNQTLETQSTDGDGHASFKNAQGFVLMGRNDRGLALLRLDEPSWELSRFDVGGATMGKGGLRAYLYPERGVHRPGDTIHLSSIIRSGHLAPEEGTPVVLKVSNARGQAAFEAKSQTNAQGVVSFTIPTQAKDQTGTWTAQLQVGGEVFSLPLRVETVKPNRLKVMAQLPEVVIGKSPSFEANFEVRYLFGMPASNSEVTINRTITAAPMNFVRYPDFVFQDPETKFEEQTEEIFSGNLNEEGKLSLNVELSNLAKVPQAAIVTLQTRVSEQGGEWTEQWQTLRAEPYSAWVGIGSKISERWVRPRDTLHVPVVVLDNKGKPLSGRKLKIRFWNNRQYWWWHYGNNQERDFRHQEQTYLAHEISLRSSDRPMMVNWVPEEDGTVLMEIVDDAGGHVSGIRFHVSEWGGGAGDQRKNREESWLDVQVDKPFVQAGDSVHAVFPSPVGAQALVTLEQAGRVLDSRWVRTIAGKTSVGFKTSAQMVPNVYVSVSLMQAQGKISNDQPMRLYGVRNIMVEDPKSRFPLVLKAPQELKPDHDFDVKVQNMSSESASFTLAVVDEGLLDLTHFETPDPWKFYYQKLELGLATVDNYDEVVGALLPDADALFQLGGDYEMVKRRKNPKARRFPVVALFSGIKYVNAGGETSVRFHMPHYVGSVRVMLVGSTTQAFVSRDKTVPVRQPLMALPTLPRVVRMGDRFQFPVAVFAMDSRVKDVVVTLRELQGLKVVGETSQKLHFDAPGEADVVFELEVISTADVARVAALVTSGPWKTNERVELPIEASAPYGTSVQDTMLKQGSRWSWKSQGRFFPGAQYNARLVLTRMPSLPSESMFRNLDAYPYGCLEQTVSGAFPYLFVDRFLEVNPNRRGQSVWIVQRALDRLRVFQAPGSGFTTWPQGQNSYGNRADPWATSWAGHFMIAARSMGYSVPEQLYNQWLKYEMEQVKQAPSGEYRNQAYRIFLLARAGKAATGAMNLLRESYGAMLDPLSARFLAAAYVQQGQDEVAKHVLAGQLGMHKATGKAMVLPSSVREIAGTYGSSLRDLALMTYVSATSRDTMGAKVALTELLREWRAESWHSTQEIAASLLAYSAVSSLMPSGSDAEFEISLPGKTQTMHTKDKPVKLDLSQLGQEAVQIHVKSGVLFARIEEGGIPNATSIAEEYSGLKMSRIIYNESGSAITLAQTEPGQSFWICYRVESLVPRQLEGLVLSSLFPSGWEIINPRLRDDLPKWLREKREPMVQYMDIRDDRVDWFFSLSGKATEEFFIRVIPTFEGDYVLPSVSVETMYSPEFQARLASGRVQIRSAK